MTQQVSVGAVGGVQGGPFFGDASGASSTRSSNLSISVLSGRECVGCKGPGAEPWLAGHGITVPSGANRYAIDSAGVLSARLATSEFLLEAMSDAANNVVGRVRVALERAEFPHGVYPVLRQDLVLEISGAHAQPLFEQTCAVPLEPVEQASRDTEGPLIMTSMIGVSVVLICRRLPEGARFTVWSDPSYSHYFQSQLLAIATDLASEPGREAPPASSNRTGGNPP